MKFRDRTEAGKQLAKQLFAYADQPDVIVLALPRGGVPVAYEVARALNVPLDIFGVRKLGVPGHEELAMGAIATGGIRFINQDLVQSLQVSQAAIEQVAAVEQRELERREQAYRDGRSVPSLRDRTVILVDDGLATGATMQAAILALRQQHPARIVVAVPVAAPETCARFEREVDHILCVNTPDALQAVGLWYDNFSQTTDEEVCALLHQAARWGQPSAIGGDRQR